MVVLPLKDQTNHHSKRNSKFVKYLHEPIQKNIEEMTKIYSRKANKGHKELVAEPGDMIWIHLRKERFPSERGAKIIPWTYGFMEKINNKEWLICLSCFNCFQWVIALTLKFVLFRGKLGGSTSNSAPASVTYIYKPLVISFIVETTKSLEK